MKKILVFLLSFASVASLYSNNKIIEITFNQEDFIFVPQERQTCCIFYNGSDSYFMWHEYIMDSPRGDIGLTGYSIELALPFATNLESVSYQHSEPRLIEEEIYIYIFPEFTANSLNDPLSKLSQNNLMKLKDYGYVDLDPPSVYPYNQYPEESVIRQEIAEEYGLVYYSCMVSPFIYDAVQHKLYFIDKFTFTMDLSDKKPTEQAPDVKIIEENKSFFYNENDIDDIISEIKDYYGNTSVESFQQPATYTVYSIDGKLLLNQATKDDIDLLSTGLYIVNGRKMHKP